MMTVSALEDKNSFSEKKWSESVMATDSLMLSVSHFKNGEYFNPWKPMPEKGFLEVMKWRFLLEKEKFSEEEESFLPNTVPDVLKKIKETKNDFALWIGHSTVLIKFKGHYFLTDPMFSNRAVIPKRSTKPAITSKELLSLNVPITVLLTHNHYDHLDAKSIKALPAGTVVYAPLGLKEIVEKMNSKKVYELDWWQAADFCDGIKIHAVPAQHWSLRAFSGRNKTLWCSFVLETPEGSIFIGGDSGYFKGFQEIGRRFPGIKLALLPIGASRPRWFMHYSHINSSEMLQAAADLGAAAVLPIHWGAFRLGEEPPGYPALELKRIISAGQTDYKGQIHLSDLGEVFGF
ncbi:MAG: MBL fold metallo-hydrolase [Fibrobacteres bacterium]|nr:MBL fold metallo-hydrolase [Fibrobacterota bacterium]